MTAGGSRRSRSVWDRLSAETKIQWMNDFGSRLAELIRLDAKQTLYEVNSVNAKLLLMSFYAETASFSV
jgi:hypothetical protein